MARTVAIYTLGCKVNQYESDALAALFNQHGYKVVDFNDPADIYVINTCAVTMQAVRKSRQAIRQARRRQKDALVVVIGCLSQIDAEEVRQLAGVDIILGANNKSQIVEVVEEALARRGRVEPVAFVPSYGESTPFEELGTGLGSERTRAQLKIQDGCQQFCAYCIIPYARGPERSRTLQSVVEEARKLVEKGFREIVLTGIHLGAYGRDLTPELELADVVKALLVETDIGRLRLSSVEPTDITASLISVIAESDRVARHLHIPLQSGCDRILKKMHRRYDTAFYRSIIRQVRTAIPEVAITTDVIVGFPGETEQDFRETLEFVKEIGFSRMHIFRFSPRPGTPAATMPNQVSGRVKSRRSKELHKIAEQLSKEFHTAMIGKSYRVLVEQEVSPGIWEGYTDNYVRTQMEGQLLTNSFVNVRIVKAYTDKVIGNVIGEGV